MATNIARNVIEIEGRDFYEHTQTADNFEFPSQPQEQNFLLPVLSGSRRAHEVRVVLPDDPIGRFVLSCRQKQSNGRVHRRGHEYDEFSKYFMKKGGKLVLRDCKRIE